MVWESTANAPASGQETGAATSRALRTAGTALAAGAGAEITTFAGTSVSFQLEASTLLLPAAVMILLGLVGTAASLRTVTTVDPLTALGSAR